MHFKILGSAASEGWPAIFCECEHCAKACALGGKDHRSRASYLINGKILIDMGPDTYFHNTRYGFFTKDLEAILITHTHADHYNPSEFLNRCWGYMSKITKRVVLAGSEAVFDVFEKATKETLDEAMLDRQLMTAGDTVELAGLQVTPVPASHSGSIDGEHAFNYVLSDGESAILIANDTGWWDDDAWQLIAGFKLDLAVIDSTFGLLNDQRKNSHMTCDVVVEFRDKLLSLGCLKESAVTVANHFSHNGGGSHAELLDYFTPNGIEVGYDGMEISLP